MKRISIRQTSTAPMRVAFPAALIVQMANLSLDNGRRIRWNTGPAGQKCNSIYPA
jgi:hypothetical protein